jgi:hypothetical protein
VPLLHHFPGKPCSFFRAGGSGQEKRRGQEHKCRDAPHCWLYHPTDDAVASRIENAAPVSFNQLIDDGAAIQAFPVHPIAPMTGLGGIVWTMTRSVFASSYLIPRGEGRSSRRSTRQPDFARIPTLPKKGGPPLSRARGWRQPFADTARTILGDSSQSIDFSSIFRSLARKVPDARADAQDAQAHAYRALWLQILGRVINFDALVKYGTISPGDLDLFRRTDSLDEAYDIITRGLTEDALGSAGPVL